MITREDLKKLTDKELKELAQMVQEELQRRREENTKEFSFYFEASCDPAKRKNPYVAKLIVKNGKVEREFKDLQRLYGKKEIRVYGQYTASSGDVIEKREGGSWKNEYRYWYLILPNGREIKVADYSSAKEKQRVISYLKNEITAEELTRDAWVKEVE